MELIDRNEVIAEIKRRIKEIDEIGTYLSPKGILTNLLCHINTLEAKEVDLVKEYDNNFSNDPVYSKLVNRNAGIGIAKHFFNLGLKTKGVQGICKIETNCPNFDEAQGTNFVRK